MHPPWINSVIVSYPAMNQDSIHVEKGRLEYDKLDDTYSYNTRWRLLPSN